jgi:hypothetical protein
MKQTIFLTLAQNNKQARQEEGTRPKRGPSFSSHKLDRRSLEMGRSSSLVAPYLDDRRGIVAHGACLVSSAIIIGDGNAGALPCRPDWLLPLTSARAQSTSHPVARPPLQYDSFIWSRSLLVTKACKLEFELM